MIINNFLKWDILKRRWCCEKIDTSQVRNCLNTFKSICSKEFGFHEKKMSLRYSWPANCGAVESRDVSNVMPRMQAYRHPWLHDRAFSDTLGNRGCASLFFFLCRPMRRSISLCFDAPARRHHRELWVTSRHPRVKFIKVAWRRRERPAISRFNTQEGLARDRRESRLTRVHYHRREVINVEKNIFSTRARAFVSRNFVGSF